MKFQNLQPIEVKMSRARFEDAPLQVSAEVEKVKEKWFPELEGARIKVVFDLKKKVSGDKIVLAKIMKANDLTRFLTIDESGSTEGFDYFIFIDKKVFEIMSDIDKVRLIRHELRHTLVDVENEKDSFKLRPHEVEDFFEEIDLNASDPRWGERVATMAEALYDQEKEDKKKN